MASQLTLTALCQRLASASVTLNVALRHLAAVMVAASMVTSGLTLQASPGINGESDGNEVDFRAKAPIACAQQAREEVTQLQLGTTLTKDLSGKDPDHYELNLTANQFVHLAVEEQGLDIVFTVSGPDHKLIAEIDNPIEAQTTEEFSFIASQSGTYKLDVRRAKRDAPAGRYTLVIMELRNSESADQARISAEQMMRQANQLRAQQTAESRAQAIEKYREAVRAYNQLKDDRAAASTFERIARTYVALADITNAVEAYNQAVASYERLKDWKNAAEQLYRTGVLYDQNNQKPKSKEVLKKALEFARTANDNRIIGTILYYLGTVENDLGDRVRAEELLVESLPFTRAALDKSGEATTLAYLGDVYLAAGKTEAAEKSYLDALALRRTLRDESGESYVLDDLGILYTAVGKPQEAINSLRHSLTIKRKLKDSYGEASALVGLGMTYSSIGALADALSVLKQAEAIKIEDTELRAQVLLSLAMILGLNEENQNALDAYERARPLIEKLNDPAAEAARVFAVGVLRVKSDDIARANESFEQAITLSQKAHLLQMEVWSQALSGLCLIALENETRAFEKLNAALPVLEAINDHAFRGLALAGLAKLEHDRGNLDAAKKRIEEALVIGESLRSNVVGQNLRVFAFTTVQDYFDLYTDILMDLHRERPADHLDVEALVVNERARSRSLVEFLKEAKADIREGVRPALLDQERSAQEKLNSAMDHQRRLLSGLYNVDQAREAANEIEAATTAYHDIEALIRQQSPRYAALTQPPPLTVEKIKAQLDPDTVLLEYELGFTASVVWLVTDREIKGYRLPPRDEISAAALNFYGYLNQASQIPSAEEARNAAKLSQMILGPVYESLGQKRLLIVADGALQFVPFAALPEPETARSSSQQQAAPLILHHEIINVPSISVLATLRSELSARPRPEKELAIIADPVFNSDDERIVRAMPKREIRSGLPKPKSPGTEGKATQPDQIVSEQRWDRLKGTRKEAEKISALIPKNQRMTALDFEANRELITSGMLSGYRNLIFATHAVINDFRPESSAIVFSQFDKTGNPVNGYLGLNEIYNLRLSADLVVLSGCRTGLGRDIRGEGFIGLARGFMYAGAARVMASLWRVDDKATSELMIQFYKGMLNEKKSPSTALRAAQLEMLKSSQWGHPHFWAAFVLQGDWKL